MKKSLFKTTLSENYAQMSENHFKRKVNFTSFFGGELWDSFFNWAVPLWAPVLFQAVLLWAPQKSEIYSFEFIVTFILYGVIFSILTLEWFSLILRVIFIQLVVLRFSLYWNVTISLFLHYESGAKGN